MKQYVMPLLLLTWLMAGTLPVQAQQPVIPLQGTFAFRDIGGYSAANGRKNKIGQIIPVRPALRSDPGGSLAAGSL